MTNNFFRSDKKNDVTAKSDQFKIFRKAFRQFFAEKT